MVHQIKKQNKKSNFVSGAWLYRLEKELTEDEFVEKAGGMKKLEKFRNFPYISLVLDDNKNPKIVGHISGRTITMTMNSHGHKKWQTMEWR